MRWGCGSRSPRCNHEGTPAGPAAPSRRREMVHHPALGERARELLVAARAHDGKIFKVEYGEGAPSVRAGEFEGTAADWDVALEELIDKGLVIYKGGSPTEHGEPYEIAPGDR